MKVRDLMTSDVAIVAPDTTFREIVKVLIENKVSGVPVVDATGHVLGVVTENDLLNKEAYPPRKDKRSVGQALLDWIAGENPVTAKAEGLRAEELMSKPPVTIGPNESVHAAARRMIEYDVKRLPVVLDGLIVGLVSRHDVLSVYARPDATLVADIKSLLVRSMYTPPDNLITVAVDDGVATLTGSVHYQSDVRTITNLVAAVDGVTGVDNQLAFREPDPTVRRPATDPRNIMTR